jgi:predicted metalloprotease
MRWQGRKGSDNIEDRRSGGGGGGGRRTGRTAGSLGIGTIILLIVALLFGVDPSELINLTGGDGSRSGVVVPSAPTTGETGTQPDDELGQFVSVVLAETEDTWNRIFPQQLNRNYQEPTLVLFSGQTRSACGAASAATGPFYCPADSKVYIDLSFYRQLRDRFQAPGDFAMAYVIAHEVGHHIQNLLGITTEVQRQRSRLSRAEYNNLSVRLELQADYLAGVWAHHTEKKNLLDAGDIEEAIRAAAAIGDDRLQRQAQGYVVPETFTHGTSEQRMRWFMKGYQSGTLEGGDTFSAREL